VPLTNVFGMGFPYESVSMVGMRQIDLLHGRIEAPAAYFEGTFNYYLWALPIAGAQLIGYPVVHADDHSYRHILLWARLITVLLDELTIVIVFLAALRSDGELLRRDRSSFVLQHYSD
jgi:hypothetical protein